jgi:hypothetical protein
MARSFHPKAIIYALYTVLLISNIYTAAIVLPLLSVFLGGIAEIILLALPVPLLIGFVLSQVLDDGRLIRSSIIGTLIIAATSATGYFANQFIEGFLVDIAQQSSQQASQLPSSVGSPAILGNLSQFGAQPSMIFAAAAIGFNLPILYQYLRED